MSTVDWKLHLVDRKDIENAFVLATGDIFFFTGLLKVRGFVSQKGQHGQKVIVQLGYYPNDVEVNFSFYGIVSSAMGVKLVSGL